MTLIDRLLRFYRTVKHLKFIQIVFRLYYRFTKPTHVLSNAELTLSGIQWHNLAYQSRSYLGEGKVIFLNEIGSLHNAECWNSESKSKLWLYNAHYFDDLNSKGYEERADIHVSLIERWIDENPAAKGNGWEPYPISLRVVNWLKWGSLQSHVPSSFLQSIRQQVFVLSQRIEFHILGNHIFANAKALIFYGIVVDSPESEAFKRKGIKLLRKELDEQFLDDGGHFELSPMYHSIMLWDLLDLIFLAQSSRDPKLGEYLTIMRSKAAKALQWISIMQHPDGEVSFFNDTALDIAPTLKDILEYAVLCDLKLATKQKRHTLLRESGYSRVDIAEQVLFFDHGKVGPDYLPGHAHADSLSIEWSVFRQRVIVNSGTSVYGESPLRLEQRGTRAHSTVEVDHSNSSEIWAGFRVARRANASLLEQDVGVDRVRIRAMHDGYRRINDKLLHYRELEIKTGVLKVQDRLDGPYQNANAFFHLCPSVSVFRLSESTIELRFDNVRIIVESTAEVGIDDGFWYPRFGKKVENKRLSMPLVNGNLTTIFSIQRT